MKEFWNQLTLREKVKFIFASCLVLIILLFTIFNWQSVDLHLVFFELEIPLTAVIVISLGAGYLASTLFDYNKFRKKDKEIRVLKKELSKKQSSSSIRHIEEEGEDEI